MGNARANTESQAITSADGRRAALWSARRILCKVRRTPRRDKMELRRNHVFKDVRKVGISAFFGNRIQVLVLCPWQFPN